MDQLAKLVSEKAGISEAQAETAVKTVLGFLEDKLPGPVAAQVKQVLAGETGDLSAKDVSDQVGKLFGKK